MTKKVFYKHSHPYQRFTIENHGNNKHTLERFVIINNCWSRNLRLTSTQEGINKALCTVNDSVIARHFF